MVLHRKVTIIDWARFERDTCTLARRVVDTPLKIDFILAINRGGAMTGVLLSHLLQVRDMLTFTIQLMARSEPNAPRHDPVIIGEEIFGRLTGKSVLLADDAVGSGETMDVARQALLSHRPAALHTAATIWNQEVHASCPADFHGGITEGWVHFPWETVPPIAAGERPK